MESTRVRRNSLLNWSNVKSAILEAASGRAHKFNRVSKSEVQPWLEAKIQTAIGELVRSNPSKGKTIYPPIRVNEQVYTE